MALTPAPALAASTSLVSLSETGLQINGESFAHSLSADGRHVGFASGSSGVVAGDSNDSYDVFLRDRRLRKTVRISVSSSGDQGNAQSSAMSLSPGGRYVAFVSEATNFAADDTNGASDVFLRDRDTDGDGIHDEIGAVSTTPVSVAESGGVADGASEGPAIAGGRYVAFVSAATDLVGGDTNGAYDVFVWDRINATTTRVSVSTGGEQAAGHSSPTSISRSGRWVAFTSDAANLVAGDTNDRADVFVRDRDSDADGIFDEPEAGSTIRASVADGGGQGDGAATLGAISADGRHVTFASDSSNLIAGDINEAHDVFVRDLRTRRTTRVNVSTRGVDAPWASIGHASISGNGRYVVFNSWSDRLVPGDTNGGSDVFVRDRDRDGDGIFDEAGAVRTRRASVSNAGGQGNYESEWAMISQNGRAVGFTSGADDLVDHDTNHDYDVFVRMHR